MLSQRRLRLLAMALVALIILVFYYSSESRMIQNQRFYQSTVAAIDAHKEAKEANKAAPAPKPVEEDTKKVLDDKMEPAIPKSNNERVEEVPKHSNEEVEEIPIAGRTKMTVPKNRHDADKQEKSDEPATSADEHTEAKAELNSILKRSPIIIFSKSYCPFSKRAKSIILEKYSIVPAPHVVELDQHPLGRELQNILGENTGRRTVPNVLVSGRSIGGGDDVTALHEKGQLASTLKNLGGKWLQEVTLKEEEGDQGVN